MTYHLIAFVVDAVSYDRARVEWAVATQDANDDWYDWNGQKLYPFETINLDELGWGWDEVIVPEGWIEHIQQIAQRDLRNRAPTFDLTTALGLHEAKPVRPFPRRL